MISIIGKMSIQYMISIIGKMSIQYMIWINGKMSIQYMIWINSKMSIQYMIWINGKMSIQYMIWINGKMSIQYMIWINGKISIQYMQKNTYFYFPQGSLKLLFQSWGRDFFNQFLKSFSSESSGCRTTYTPWISESLEEKSWGWDRFKWIFFCFLSNIGYLKLT